VTQLVTWLGGPVAGRGGRQFQGFGSGAELNRLFNSPGASPRTLCTDQTPPSGRQLQDDPSVLSAPVKLNPAHRIQQLLRISASVAKLLQNGGGVGKPFVGLERAKGFDQAEPVKCQKTNGVGSGYKVVTYIKYLGATRT
jgi:hypothetical protein